MSGAKAFPELLEIPEFLKSTWARAAMGGGFFACIASTFLNPAAATEIHLLQGFLAAVGAASMGLLLTDRRQSSASETLLQDVSQSVRNIVECGEFNQRVAVRGGGAASALARDLNALISRFASREKRLQRTVAEPGHPLAVGFDRIDVDQRLALCLEARALGDVRLAPFPSLQRLAGMEELGGVVECTHGSSPLVFFLIAPAGLHAVVMARDGHHRGNHFQ